MEYITRDMEKLILQVSAQYSTILVTGPRQTGKTTMLRRLMEIAGDDREYVSLDDLGDRQLARYDPAMFFQIHKPPILIDEVQYAPQLFPYIKMQVDRNNRPGDFWMTGSQLFKLMEGVQESLAGRVALLHLSPMSQNEITGRHSPLPFSLDLRILSERQEKTGSVSALQLFERIFTGSMPAVVSGRYTDRNLFYSSYLSTYIDRDVRDLSGTIDSLKFMNFITSTAARTGQLVNYKGISDDCDIDQSTAKNWLRILETLGIIFYLHPYSNNMLKRTIKTPKLYFYDTGLVCFLTKWTSADTVMNGAMNGALLENYAISEVMKSYQNAGLMPPLYFYRDKDSKEIDLVIERDGQLFPMEIKKTALPQKSLTKVFSVLSSSAHTVGTTAVLCMAEKLTAFDSENLVVPIALI